jgi:hypothetical protein
MSTHMPATKDTGVSRLELLAVSTFIPKDGVAEDALHFSFKGSATNYKDIQQAAILSSFEHLKDVYGVEDVRSLVNSVETKKNMVVYSFSEGAKLYTRVFNPHL